MMHHKDACICNKCGCVQGRSRSANRFITAAGEEARYAPDRCINAKCDGKTFSKIDYGPDLPLLKICPSCGQKLPEGDLQ